LVAPLHDGGRASKPNVRRGLATASGQGSGAAISTSSTPVSGAAKDILDLMLAGFVSLAFANWCTQRKSAVI